MNYQVSSKPAKPHINNLSNLKNLIFIWLCALSLSLLAACSQVSEKPEDLPLTTLTSPHGIVFVDKDATGANDGTWWTDAFTSLQDALDCLRNGDPSCTGASQIWVASGVYYPDEGVNVTNNDETESFYLIPSVQMYGGFDGVGPGGVGGLQEFSTGDSGTYLTILSGDIDGNDNDPNGDDIIEDTNDIVGINSNHVVYLDSVGLQQAFPTTTRLMGFTITAGHTLESFVFGKGAGLFCNGSLTYTCAVTLENLHFAGNFAEHGAGAIYMTFSDLSIGHSSFTGNTANNSGGAILSGSSELSVSNSSFVNNFSDIGGGAIKSYESEVTIDNASFSENVARDSGGAISSNTDSITITDSSFIDNKSGTFGGGALKVSDDSGLASVTISRSRFIGNTSEEGGAILTEATSFISNSIFTGNKANDDGGAIYISEMFQSQTVNNISIVNTTFSENEAAVDGNRGRGGSIYFYSSDPSTLEIVNGILWNGSDENGNNEIYNYGGIVVLNHSLVKKWTSTGVVTGSSGTLSDQGGNLLGAPRFIDRDGPDNIIGTEDDDLRLMDSSYRRASPAIDAGDSDEMTEMTDLDSVDRFIDDANVIDTGSNTSQDSVVDMGAYESQ